MTVTATIPKRVTDIPSFAAAEDRLTELQLKKLDLAEQLTEIESKARQVAAEPGAERVRSEARALVSGGDVDLGPTREDLEEQIASIQHEHRVVAEAIELQRKIVTKRQEEASREICKANEPEFREIVQQIGDVLRQLKPALERERTFREGLSRDGRVFLYPPIRYAGLVNADQTEYMLDLWTQEFGGMLDDN